MTTFDNLEADFKRLFRDIPRPDPLEAADTMLKITSRLEAQVSEELRPKLFAVAIKWISREEAEAMFDPVDADETNHGPCAQGDCDE